MEQLERTKTQKRRRPRAGMIVLAAALAAGALLSVAAGLPARVYNFATGGQVVYTESGVGSIAADASSPVKAENGRLWFEADGQTVDITGMVDENTPYIYERTDPVTGEKGYVIAGGTAEDFGWTEFSVVDGKISVVLGSNYADYLARLPDGSEVDLNNFTVEQFAQMAENNGESGGDLPTVDLPGLTGREVIHPWLQAALDQLGLQWWLP